MRRPNKYLLVIIVMFMVVFATETDSVLEKEASLVSALYLLVAMIVFAITPGKDTKKKGFILKSDMRVA